MESHNFQTAIPTTNPHTDTFFNENSIVDLNQLKYPAQPGPRLYKSRKYRPCDFCRNRQNGRRRRSGQRLLQTMVKRMETQIQGFDVSSTQISPGFLPQYSEHHFQGLNGHDILSDSNSSSDQHILIHNGSPVYIDPFFAIQGPHTRPLDSPSSMSARFIGETGESNPYLLRHYHYDENDECTISKLTYRRIRSSAHDEFSNSKEPPVVFMLADNSFTQKGEPRLDDDVLAKAQAELRAMFTDVEALRLIGLFFRFVYPYFPILCKMRVFQSPGILLPTVLDTIPLSLLSAMFAAALPFMIYDDILATSIVHSPPSAHRLFRLSWLFIQQELHTPRLATVQACLLLLQRAPTNPYTTDTPWKTSLMGWTNLGLMRECGDWGIPAWEAAMRKRIWHAVFIMDKWASLGAGMPSHIRSDDFDVLPLQEADLEAPCPDPNPHGIQAFTDPESDCEHFRLLAELTAILSDIIDSFYTVRAAQRTSKDFVLSLDLARPLRSRLKAWNESLPPAMSLRPMERVDSQGLALLSANPSLSLAYIIATMSLFRALLRPLENVPSVDEGDHGIAGSRQAVRAGAKECAKEVVEFVENLGRGTLDAFWHSWSRANFSIASSFLMQILVTSENEAEANEINELVTRWRWALRIGSGSSGNALMSLGLLRLDGLLLESGGTNLS
ncbi:hypothetical protein CJF30_00001996 [Rutstroemia sp. NJR-2017a BBW]|nr:hypothetical protein CJF30_00001996 [Rutstroemia sp. NJR-2017a BBW]